MTDLESVRSGCGPEDPAVRERAGRLSAFGSAAASRHAIFYRIVPGLAALTIFLFFLALYFFGGKTEYMALLRLYGIVPFRFPFVDISGSLAAWDCARLGVDVVVRDPCDVLSRPYNYSPLWMAASFIPLGTGETGIVGWTLGLIFILCLPLLPPARQRWELALVVLATVSTMVVFAVERANPDLLIFLLALAAGYLLRGPLAARDLAYSTILLAALIKYYPITLLLLSLRERISAFSTIGLTMSAVIAAFLLVYFPDIARGLPTIASGSYFTDLFAAKNLPFAIADIVAGRHAPAADHFLLVAIRGTLYGVLLLLGAASCRLLLTRTALQPTFARISAVERDFLVIGSTLIIGCFFAGQNIGYRGVFLLFVLPGLLAVARAAEQPNLRQCCRAAAIVLVLLMWEECCRTFLERAGFPLPVRFGFWLARELAWWWIVSLMSAFLASFVAQSQTLADVLRLCQRRRGYRTARP